MRTARTPKNAHEAQLVPIESLKPYPGNARTHDLDVIRESLRVNTQYRPIVVRTRTRHVLAGNGTLEAAKAEGWAEIWATFIDCDAKAARRINLVDNRANDLAGWDEQLLAAQLGDLPGVEGTGWSERELVSFVARVNGPGEDTEPSEAPKVPRTKLGDLWVLGEHRLLCGDATVDTDVSRLMDGELAHMVFTDPPYGVDYRGGMKPRERLDGDGRGNDVYEASLALMVSVAAPQAAFYVWYADLSIAAAAAAAAAGLMVRGQIVWVKNNAQFVNNAHYHGKHEPCIYASLPTRAPNWYGPKNEVTVWEYDRAQSNDFHPTQKPIDLAERAGRNSSQPGDIVLDPFAGSGSTLIACENLSRRCYAMEIDPGYCDVIVDRWERHTGKKATRART